MSVLLIYDLAKEDALAKVTELNKNLTGFEWVPRYKFHSARALVNSKYVY